MSLNPFKRKTETKTPALFDEAFLRRLERLTYRTVPTLRGGRMGERRSRNLRPAQDFNDHRPYAIGDDLRHVDWHAYARHRELFVKLGEAMQRLDLHILLDTSPSMSWVPTPHFDVSAAALDPSAATLKWNRARQLVGALSYLALAGGERLIITPFAPALGDKFGPTHGKRQIPATLNYLTALTPSESDSPSDRSAALEEGLAVYAQTHPQGGVLLLLSDLWDTLDAEGQDASQHLAAGLHHLAAPRWQVMVMHLLTEQEVQPTLKGDFDFEDIETRETLPYRLDQPTLAQYRLRMRRWCADLERVCAGRGAIYSRLLTEWPLEQKVIPYLRQRRLLE